MQNYSFLHTYAINDSKKVVIFGGIKKAIPLIYSDIAQFYLRKKSSELLAYKAATFSSKCSLSSLARLRMCVRLL